MNTMDKASKSELLHWNARFRFLVNCLVENFIEIRVKTGDCRMFHSENGMQVYSTLKEQIAWWADHYIVPEEREAYLKEYDLENLVSALRMKNGYHSATYTSRLGDTKRNILIVSRLIDGIYGIEEEYIFAYAQDITPMKEQESRNKQLVDISQQLLNLSQTEPVTGLFNRAACEKLIEEHLSNCQNINTGTMLLIDIDYFKNFNDQYGHQTGDFVLKFLGRTMQNVFRSDDIICRWGGDEFVVFMRDIYDKNNVNSRIERLRIRLRQCKKDNMPLPITISIGGTIAKQQMTLKELFDHCDKALYQVKIQGRDDFSVDFML